MSEKTAGEVFNDIQDLASFVGLQQKRIDDLTERFQSAGWRSCIDHIIKPESSCPVCRIEELTARVQYLVDHWPVPLEDNGITFPDGEFWERKE